MMNRKYLLIVQSPSGPIRFAMVLSLSPGRCSGYCEFRGNIVPIETVQIDSRQQVELKGTAPISSGWFRYRVSIPMEKSSFDSTMEIGGNDTMQLHGKVA